MDRDNPDELEIIRLKKMQELMKNMATTQNKTEGKGKVIVYSTQTCPYCYMAKDYLTAKGIKYDDVDVGRDHEKAREMIAKSGQMGVPVLDINGQIILGFDQGAIDAALSRGAGRS